MSNILDYIDWRGDLTVAEAPFCEIDNLILTQLSFLDLIGIAEGENLKQSISVSAAAKIYFGQDKKHDDGGLIMPDQLPFLFRKAADSKRFGNMRIARFCNIIDKKIETQFAALCIIIGDGSFYVSFRGTDDTLVGWKENFNMGYMERVPAQEYALLYLTDAAANLRGKIRVGGHSKGGNLSLYSASNAPRKVQSRIINVYNNDGPGFGKSITSSGGYSEIAGRVLTVVPQFSVVGLLLEHGDVDKIVKSNGEGLWQHDPYTWEVLGDKFVLADGLTRESKRIEKTLKAWVAELTTEQRREMIEALYKAFTVNNAATLTDIAADKMDFVKLLGKLDGKARDILVTTGKLLLREGIRVVQEDTAKTPKKPLISIGKPAPKVPKATKVPKALKDSKK